MYYSPRQDPLEVVVDLAVPSFVDPVTCLGYADEYDMGPLVLEGVFKESWLYPTFPSTLQVRFHLIRHGVDVENWKVFPHDLEPILPIGIGKTQGNQSHAGQMKC
jgi:hypothetical protein